MTASDVRLIVKVIGDFLDGESLGEALSSGQLAKLNDALTGIAVGLICEAIPGLNEVTLGIGCLVVSEVAEHVADEVNP